MEGKGLECLNRISRTLRIGSVVKKTRGKLKRKRRYRGSWTHYRKWCHSMKPL